MGAVKYLAWHVIHACDELLVYDQLAHMQPVNRKLLAQWINQCLQQGKRIKTVLRQTHVDEISELLQQSDDEQLLSVYTDFVFYVLQFGTEKIEAKLESLQEF